MKTIRQLSDEIETIEARPIPRAERDALQDPLVKQLRELESEQRINGRIQRRLALDWIELTRKPQ